MSEMMQMLRVVSVKIVTLQAIERGVDGKTALFS